MKPSHIAFVTLTLHALVLAACDGGPVLTDRDAGISPRIDASIDAGRGDAGPPMPDGGPTCAMRDPIVPTDPLAGAWDRRFANPGVGGDRPNVEAFAFGAGGAVYIGGDFTLVGYAPALNVAQWDGAGGWRAMGAGLNGRVRSLAVGGDGRVWASYAPDDGWDATRIARWDGTSWTTIADATDGSIEEITLVGTTLLAAGSFTQIGGVDAAGLARYDGATWSGWTGLAPDGSVEAISATSLDDICIGGAFDTLGIVATIGAACWNGTTWEPRTLPLVHYLGIYDLQRDTDGTLVAAGNFMLDELGTNGGSIARWETDHWALIGGGVMVLGPGSTGNVRGLAITPTGMYIAGAFSSVGGSEDEQYVQNVARWDGTQWHDIGGVFMEVGIGLPTDNVYGVAAAPDGSVFFGGLFSRAGTVRVSHVVRWDGTYWSSLRTPGEEYEGVGGGVYALARHGACTVYMGGTFEYAGEVRANSIAAYTREGGYQALGDGVNGGVSDIAVTPRGIVYAGGSFLDGTTGTEFANVAMWDGSDWSGLGAGIDGQAWAVAVEPSEGPDSPDRVYAAGEFAQAGGAPASSIAVWNGEAWSALDVGVEGWPFDWDPAMFASPTVYDVLIDEESGDVIVGGSFAAAGSGGRRVDAHNIARWDGERWHAYGEGLGDNFGAVMSLAMWNGRLVASGSFDQSGTTPVSHVAQWTGTAWERVGASGPSGYSVSQILSVGDVLFAGGVFSVTEGGPDAHVAAFDGTTWRDLDSGVNDLSEALIEMDEGVYMGGSFVRAGSVPSVGLALWQYGE